MFYVGAIPHPKQAGMQFCFFLEEHSRRQTFATVKNKELRKENLKSFLKFILGYEIKKIAYWVLFSLSRKFIFYKVFPFTERVDLFTLVLEIKQKLQ